MYVVDSIIRVYIEQAKKIGEELTPTAPDGTFSAGINKITELIESIIDNSMELMIDNSQKVKIGKLIDIWERAETFKPELIAKLRSKYFKSTTPPGSPKAVGGSISSNLNSSKDSGSILLALATLAKTSNSNESTPSSNPDTNATNILSQLTAMAGNNPVPPSNSNNNSNNSNGPPAPNEQYIFNMLQQMQGNGQAPPPQQHQPLGHAPPASLPVPPVHPSVPQRPPQIDYNNVRRGGREEAMGGVTNYSRRNRSRSPPRYGAGNMRDRSPRQQYQQQYGQAPPQQYQQNNQHHQQQQQQHGQYGGGQYGGNNGGNGSAPPPTQGGFQALGVLHPQEMNIQGTPHYRPRNVGFDQTLPQGSLKVLSRTLFMGGVPRSMGERELAAVLRPYAEVQSIILNSDRKHAFVKVYSRREAEQVITSFNKDNSLPLRTRWGLDLDQEIVVTINMVFQLFQFKD